MPRRPRIAIPGYHHIVNRGVNRQDIFSDEDDKEKFLQIVCKACRVYGVILHDYCLMDNHYHILIENSKENLSLFMRQINANYAIYYNKKTKRTGHLWQGRYSSWYITSEDYLYRTIRYIEYNPIEAGLSQSIVGYPHTLASVILNGEEAIACSKYSMLIVQYDIETLNDFLGEMLSDEEQDTLEKERRKKIEIVNNKAQQQEKRDLKSYFDKSMSKSDRNQAIFEAYRDGHTQASISKLLGLSDAMISIIIKKFRI